MKALSIEIQVGNVTSKDIRSTPCSPASHQPVSQATSYGPVHAVYSGVLLRCRQWGLSAPRNQSRYFITSLLFYPASSIGIPIWKPVGVFLGFGWPTASCPPVSFHPTNKIVVSGVCPGQGDTPLQQYHCYTLSMPCNPLLTVQTPPSIPGRIVCRILAKPYGEPCSHILPPPLLKLCTSTKMSGTISRLLPYRRRLLFSCRLLHSLGDTFRKDQYTRWGFRNLMSQIVFNQSTQSSIQQNVFILTFLFRLLYPNAILGHFRKIAFTGLVDSRRPH